MFSVTEWLELLSLAPQHHSRDLPVTMHSNLEEKVSTSTRLLLFDWRRIMERKKAAYKNNVVSM